MLGKMVVTTNGIPFWVSPQDERRVKEYQWHYNQKTGYIHRCAYNPINKKPKTIYLTHFILGYDGDDTVDHKNGVKTDNRRTNLEICTQKENVNRSEKVKECIKERAKKVRYKNKSGYVGVHPHVVHGEKTNKWRVNIGENKNGKKKTYYLGIFDNAEDAARARDKKAIEIHGRGNIYLNFPDE
jgi:hypothetical protein